MTDSSVLIVLQARVGSQRLPGKVLAPVAGVPLLEYCVSRLRAASVGRVVVATTTGAEDAAVRALARRLDVEVFAGPGQDVLARYALVAEAHPEAAYVLRATGDNPFVDIDAPARLLKVLDGGADYAVEEGLPLGAAVEGVRRDVLLQAHREAVTAYDREHVTPWVRRAEGVARVVPAAPPDISAPDLRFTVDTADDLAYVRRLAGLLTERGHDPRLVPLHGVITLARSLPAREVA